MLRGLVIVISSIVILFHAGCRAGKQNDPSAPLNRVQESQIIRTLALSDRLDICYSEKQIGKEFISSSTRLQAEAAIIEAKLPRKNAVRALFVNTVKAYDQAAVSALQNAKSSELLPHEKLDALFAMAEKRKTLLRKVLSSPLNEEERKLFKEWSTTP